MDQIYLYTIIQIALFWAVAVITPGPNFLITMNSSIHHGRISALCTVGGIVLGTAIWTVSGFLGINILFIIAPWLYSVIKIAGAAYLIYLGISRICTSHERGSNSEVRKVSRTGFFRKGLMVNLSNPKTAIFIASLFATAVPEKVNSAVGFLSVLTILGISFTWYSVIALVFSNQTIRDLFVTRKQVLNKVTGALFIALGLKVLTSDAAAN